MTIESPYGLPERDLQEVRRVLAGFPQIRSATLYGSRAKGTFRPGSDIDLTLVGHELDESLLSRVDTALDDLLLPWIFDLSIFDRLENEDLIAHIKCFGKEVYTRNT